jgi:hypothetical protein
MQENLWGEEVIPIQHKPHQTTGRHLSPSVPFTPDDCLYFGHTWQVIGMQGEKQCTLCHIKGYCPGCTPTPPGGAHPFFCTMHTPQPREAGEP